MNRRAAVFSMMITAFAGLRGNLYAQSVFMAPMTESGVGFQYLKPSFKPSSADVSGYVWILNGRIRLTDRLILLLQIPYAGGKYEFTYQFFGQTYSFSESNSTVGNIAAALRIETAVEGLAFDIAARFPLASESAAWATNVGAVVLPDAIEAFIPNVLPFNGAVNYIYRSETGFNLEGRLGSTFLIKTKKSSPGITDDTETLAGGSLLLGFDGGSVFGRVGGTMTVILTESGDLDQRTYQQLGAMLGTRFGILRVSGHFRWPVDKTFKNVLDNIYGFETAVEF